MTTTNRRRYIGMSVVFCVLVLVLTQGILPAQEGEADEVAEPAASESETSQAEPESAEETLAEPEPAAAEVAAEPELEPSEVVAQPEPEAVEEPVEAESSLPPYLERAVSGFTNVFFGPWELVYQMKEEVKRTDPVRGFIPGLVKGLGWCGVREGVGVFELLTFYLPHQPVVKPFDTEWVYA